jgi:hypothetical protein
VTTTITTTGYGDVFPITGTGKFLAFVAMVVGVLLIALPSIIIGRNFSVIWGDLRAKNKVPELPTWLKKINKNYHVLPDDQAEKEENGDEIEMNAVRNDPNKQNSFAHIQTLSLASIERNQVSSVVPESPSKLDLDQHSLTYLIRQMEEIKNLVKDIHGANTQDNVFSLPDN